MWQDPYTLVVSLGKDLTASGELYSDDGDSFAYQQGDLVWRGFKFSPEGSSKAFTLTSRDLVQARPEQVGVSQLDLARTKEDGWAAKIGHVRVERIVVLGLKNAPKKVLVGEQGEEAEFEWTAGVGADSKREGRASELVVKNPAVLITRDWDIRFE